MINSRKFTATKLSLSVALALTALVSQPVSAFTIDTGIPGAEVHFDNTVRYNLGWRMEDVNPVFYRMYGNDETDGNFKKHDLIMNRLDLLSELDYTGKRENGLNYGARVSAALWSENAYSKTSSTNPQLDALGVPSNYGTGGQWSSYAKRFVTGSSGELLDAFVFGGVELGNTNLNIKLGKHTVYWGEANFNAGVAVDQAAIDAIKGQSSPGAQTKELFMPLNQLTANWALNPEWSVLGQYTFDWVPTRSVPGGTYFAAADGSGNLFGADPLCGGTAPAGHCMPSLAAITPGRNGGDWGLAARWSPSWWDGTMGFYYRKFDEKNPWASLQLAGGNPQAPNALALRLSYARDTELIGYSITHNMFGYLNVGFEAVYRRNTALNSVTFMTGSQGFSGVTDISSHYGLPAGSIAPVPNYYLSAAANTPLNQTPDYSAVEGARGNTIHLILNAITLLDKTALYETGTLVTELGYQRLDKVTKNPNVFNSVDYACKNGYLPLGLMPGATDKSDGCSTKDSLAANIMFTPQWMGALPSVDLSMPISVTYDVFGNTPVNGGNSNKGAYTWSIGLTANYRNTYEVGVLLSDQHRDYKTAVDSGATGLPGGITNSTSNGPMAVQNSHRWLSAHFKTAF